ncbi:3'-5' exonuclease [Lignipirellula cremea]|uniref:DNA 3'-5' helicase n=1 Tax=Lignipirellula cremea TaxID=2528010 RepID=A0A518DWQ7_9BACT|nr:3'-5' exonuclease [Lignipirellula cremea]QDU96254.1 Putative ATP-dependent DNA helicase YjcD [Lignipirellula cremea]
MSAVSLSKTFAASTKKLSTPDRGRVFDFLTKFMEDPASPGVNFETIQGSKDSNLKSARITQDLRTILHQGAGMLTLLYAGHHEDAYRWAQHRRVENHPVTGTLQIVETTESVQAEIQDTAPTYEVPKVFADYNDEYLISLGLPQDWLTIVRQIQNEDQLLAVCQKLPEEVSESLLTLSTGELVTPPKPVAPTAPVEQNPDNLRRFWVVQDAAELANILDRPIEDWVRFLHPSQRLLVTRDFNGPAKVSGAAGTGKTVVGMHRARRLAAEGKRVLLTSFVTTLCRNIERNIHVLCAGTQNAFDGSTESRITVSTVHKQALALARTTHPKIHPVDSDKIEALVKRHHGHGGYLFDTGFLVTEWNGVVEAQGITTWEEYRDAVRTGRGKPLTIKQRKDCWKVFARIWEDLTAAQAYPWSGICRIAREAVESGAVTSPFDAVIVDEVQDLQPADLQFLKALAAKDPGNLMVLGDAGQRIYPGGFSLKKLGIDIRGRSHILRINYRTTEQIRRFADGLLAGAADDMDEGAEDRRSQSLLNGPAPTVQQFPNDAEQVNFVLGKIQALLQQGLSPRELAIFARSGKHLKSVRDALLNAGMEICSLSDNEDVAAANGINLGTMHRAKGLEFKVVFIVDCNQGVVPHAYTLGKLRDQGDYDAGYERERQLLYVAITRARDEVFLTGVGKPSEFLTANEASTRGSKP